MPHRQSMLALYIAHRGALVNYANGITGDRAHAEDVVQEAWLRLGATAAQRPLDEPIGYLYRIVRNLAVDGRRRAVRYSRIVEQQDVAHSAADDYPSPEAAAAARNELRLLMDVMAELPERTRIALEMRRLGGYKFREIAAHLGISVTAAHDIVAEGIAHCVGRVRPPL